MTRNGGEFAPKKIAFVHDWLTGMRGGEKVLEAACELFPDAEIYTLIHRPERVSAALNSRRLHVSWLNVLPGAYIYYRYLLPFMPSAIESFDLGDFDLVVSFSHCVAKGVRLTPRMGRRAPLHLCYCHTPMRYVYEQLINISLKARGACSSAVRLCCALIWLIGTRKQAGPWTSSWPIAKT